MLPSTGELDSCILLCLDWHERDYFDRADLETDPQLAHVYRLYAESETGGALEKRGAVFDRVLSHVQKCWPDVHHNAVSDALERLEDAGLARRDKATILGTPECTIWRVNLDSELRSLIYRIHASASDTVQLSDVEMTKLDAYLSTRDRPAVTLSGLQGDSVYHDNLDAEKRQQENLRFVLEYNRRHEETRQVELPHGERTAEAKAPKRKRRGRKPDTDPRADNRVAEAWDSGQHMTYAGLGRDMDMSGDDVKRAIDRNRKRRKNGRR